MNTLRALGLGAVALFARRCLRTALLIGVMMATGISVVRAAGWYDNVLPVPANLQKPVIQQPIQGGTAANPQSVACVSASGCMILQDLGYSPNTEMAAGYYAPVCTENSNTHVVMVKPAEDRI